jgi:MFS family permease
LISVPLHAIAEDFDAPIPVAVLSVSVFILVFAVSMPFAGWLGDRFGQKRTIIAALVLLIASQLAAAVAPSLAFLVTTRAIQGLACSTVPPLVMRMLSALYPDRKLTVMGAWAAANGVGHALGPPIGGIGSDLAGWRSTFVFMAVCSLVCLVLIAVSVPSMGGKVSSLDFRSAVMLAGGASLVLATLITLGIREVPIWPRLAAASAGLALLAGYVTVSRDNPRSIVPVSLFSDRMYLRSCVSTFTQMFTFGTVLVVVPLHLTGALDMSSSMTGIIFFAMPLTMIVTAPVASRVGVRFGIHRVLRAGFTVIFAGCLAAGLVTEHELFGGAVWPVIVTIVVLGAAMALVQTPAAAGATISSAGGHGGGLGMFNLLRFSGSTSGTAWVALMYPSGHLFGMFIGCMVLASVGFAMSFLRGATPPL